MAGKEMESKEKCPKCGGDQIQFMKPEAAYHHKPSCPDWKQLSEEDLAKVAQDVLSKHSKK